MLSARVVRNYQKNYPLVMNSINKLFLQEAKIHMVGEVMRLAPHDSGRLENSIRGKVKNDQAIIGTNVVYAPYQEYGTKKMPAQSFLRKGLDLNRRFLVTRWRQLFRKTFRTLGKL